MAGQRRACRGELACGDVYDWWAVPGGVLLCLVDGLGHGPEAREAAQVAVASVGAERDEDLPHILRQADAALRTTRGAALALARVDLAQGVGAFIGVGNVQLSVLTPPRRLHSDPGTLGNGAPPAACQRFEFPPASGLVMFTDGVDPDVALDRHALRMLPVAAVAADLLRRWAREDDDAAVLVAHHEEAGATAS